MQNYFIYENDKPSRLQYMFNIVQNVENRIIIPSDLNVDKVDKKIKIAEKVVKILKKSQVQNVVISKILHESEEFKNILYQNGINIFDGRWLFTYLLNDIIKYLEKENNIKEEDTEIAIMTNFVTDVIIQNILDLSKKFKRLNIITNHIEYFRRIEEDLYNNLGIMITISNNKKKSLLKSNIILNMDFPQELIQKFNINENAIIINFDDDIKITKKRFNGINIINYELENNLNMEELGINNIEKFYIRDIYEALLYKKSSYKNIIKAIDDLHINIKELIGNHGNVFVNR